MGFEVVFNHVYKFPLDLVIHTHLTKYPSKKMDVMGVVIEEQRYDKQNAVHYWKRVMRCRNILPGILRKLPALDVDAILLEEEGWYYRRDKLMKIRSRNRTWDKYALAWEESELRPSTDSHQWTVMSQRGGLDVKVFGAFGQVLELFLHGLAKRNGQKAIKYMEDLLTERQKVKQLQPRDFFNLQP